MVERRDQRFDDPLVAATQIAQRFGGSLVDDDVNGYLPTAAPPPLSAFAPEISY